MDATQRLEVDERAVFLKFELFAKRLGKLCDMFTSIHQISGLEQHTHITGGWVVWCLATCFPKLVTAADLSVSPLHLAALAAIGAGMGAQLTALAPPYPPPQAWRRCCAAST